MPRRLQPGTPDRRDPATTRSPGHLAISPASCAPDSVCFPQQGQKKRANRKEPAVLLVIAVLLLALILFGVGFAVHVLWWIALIVLALWLLGFLFRSAEGGGSRRRWYRW
jgi:fatty acid desaturase